MTQIATTIEQSKKLIELGLSADTADMHYSKWDNDEEEEYHLKCGGFPKLDFKYAKNIPAWSLSKLLELMPLFIVINGKESSKLQMKKVDEEGNFGVYYWVNQENNVIKGGITPLDAAFEMMCYLLENKMIQYGTGK